MRRLALTLAVLASIATSREVPGEDPGFLGQNPTRAVVENHGDESIELGLAFAPAPDCALLAGHPWLATGLSFEEGVVLVLPAGQRVALLEDDLELEPACYVARLTLGDEEAVVYVGEDRALHSPLRELGMPAELPRIVVHPDGPSTFVDGGEGLLQDPDELAVCESVELPTWTLPAADVDGPVEGLVEEVSEGPDCTALVVDGQRFELCGAGPLGVLVGDPARLEVTDTVFDLDVFGGPRVVAGRGLERLFIEPVVVAGDGLCATTTDCGGVTDGLLELGDEVLAAGDETGFDEGRLVVFAVDHPLQQGCQADAEILYVQR